MTSNSIPMEGSGVRMSENIMTPSVPKARKGCRESSIAISGVSERLRKGYLLLKARKSFMYLPACLMSQTGARSVASPLAARRRMSCSAFMEIDSAADARRARTVGETRSPAFASRRANPAGAVKALAPHAQAAIKRARFPMLMMRPRHLAASLRDMRPGGRSCFAFHGLLH